MAVTMSFGVSVTIRTQFSCTHALSAALLARETAKLERDAEAPSLDLIRASATGAIMTSVAFLEGTINEFFIDLVEDDLLPAWKAALDPAASALAARLWTTAELQKLPCLVKFDAALEFFTREPFDRGAQPYQDAKLVVQTRNVLVHAKPVTHSDIVENSTAEAVRLSEQLRPKFKANRFMGNNASFPDGVLGAGGAAWAFRSCLAFTDQFFRKMGVPARYEVVRDRLVVP